MSEFQTPNEAWKKAKKRILYAFLAVVGVTFLVIIIRSSCNSSNSGRSRSYDPYDSYNASGSSKGPDFSPKYNELVPYSSKTLGKGIPMPDLGSYSPPSEDALKKFCSKFYRITSQFPQQTKEVGRIYDPLTHTDYIYMGKKTPEEIFRDLPSEEKLDEPKSAFPLRIRPVIDLAQVESDPALQKDCFSTPWQCYRLLGVPINATKEKIKEVYRKLSLQFHPDKIAQMQNENKKDRILMENTFKRINYALLILEDVNKRRLYDRICLGSCLCSDKEFQETVSLYDYVWNF